MTRKAQKLPSPKNIDNIDWQWICWYQVHNSLCSGSLSMFEWDSWRNHNKCVQQHTHTHNKTHRNILR